MVGGCQALLGDGSCIQWPERQTGEGSRLPSKIWTSRVEDKHISTPPGIMAQGAIQDAGNNAFKDK
jgi:hypothetical protein